MDKKDAIKKFIDSFCSVKSVLTIAFGIAVIFFTKDGIVDGEKFLSIATLLLGSLVGAAGKNAAVENARRASENPTTNHTITVETQPLQITTANKPSEPSEMTQSAANVGE